MIIVQGYEWATHQPLIRAVLDLYKPKFILELGIGIYSTPLFKNHNAMFIENDKDWIELMSKELEIEIIHHDLGGIHDYDLVNQISREQQKEIEKYYKKISIPKLKPNLLFVDQVPSCRLISINALRDKFDIIIYHDDDEQGRRLNYYDLINREGFNYYSLHTDLTGVGCMIRQKLDNGKLIETAENYIELFIEEWPLCTNMYVDSR